MRKDPVELGKQAREARYLENSDMVYSAKDDILIHTGDDYAAFMGAISPPIYQSSLFVQPTERNGVKKHHHLYTRTSNPTADVAEQKLAALEHAEAALFFSSGMAAISSAIMHFVKKDCHIIFSASTYGPARDFISRYLVNKFGVTHTIVNGDDAAEIEAAISPRTSLIYLESPSSGIFLIQDIAEIARIAKLRGIGTVIDNTYATPLHQNPLLHGIDIVCHTASKYLGGHSDVVAGALASSKEIVESIRWNELHLFGGCIDAHQAWLVIRGMRTLSVRLQRHGENGLKIANYLKNHPKVERVFYPGINNGPQNELYKKYLSGGNGLVSFVPKTSNPGEIWDFIEALRMFQLGCSWGGYESLVWPYAVGDAEEEATKRGCPRNMVRIHVGLECTDTLINDLENAFEKITIK